MLSRNSRLNHFEEIYILTVSIGLRFQRMLFQIEKFQDEPHYGHQVMTKAHIAYD
jgi:hypothetical protein